MRRILLGSLVAAGLAAVAAGGAAAWAWWELNRPHAGWEGDSVTVVLPAGESAASMVRDLGDAGVLRRPGLVDAWLRLAGGDESLHAGEYRFDRPVTPRSVLEKLRLGEVVLHAVTVPEGLTLGETARLVAVAGFADEAALLETFSDPGPVLDLDPEAGSLEGYLFPDTYHFPRRETPERIAGALVQRFREVTGNDYVRRAAEVGLGLRESVVLASLIEKETAVPEERGRISRVFHNRLERGMLLQCDPTVLYALRRDGRTVGRLSRKDLQYDSPWNTYRYGGLPPGPICSPGRESLQAAVEPSGGDELYFVASPDGGHRFSATLEGHLEAVRIWRNYSRSSR